MTIINASSGMREDNRAIVRAASPASKAADYLLSFVPDPVASASAHSAAGECEAA
jgi:antirestriction protein ArdC